MSAYDPRITTILERDGICDEIAQMLQRNDSNSSRLECAFVYGPSGVGKTTMITCLLDRLNYEIRYYNASDLRNKNVFDEITKLTHTSNNVLHMFQGKKRNICIVVDEVEGVNTGDRCAINTLIRHIRGVSDKPKRKKTHDLDVSELKCTIICICNQQIDKKMVELMKVCKIFYLSKPTHVQMREIVHLHFQHTESHYIEELIHKSNEDLRKLLLNIRILAIVDIKQLCNVLYMNNVTLNLKNVIYTLLTLKKTPRESHIFNTDINRMMVSLIWHENIVDYLDTTKDFKNVYYAFLDNMCKADVLDRITFQKQLWSLSEMTANTKVLHNHIITVPYLDEQKIEQITMNDIRFTKVLTKYSIEYNNHYFVQGICSRYGCDRFDLFRAVMKYTTVSTATQALTKVPFKMTHLEAKRLYKFAHKIDYSTKVNSVSETEHDVPDLLTTEFILNEAYEPDEACDATEGSSPR